jgi:hypothetical protein
VLKSNVFFRYVQYLYWKQACNFTSLAEFQILEFGQLQAAALRLCVTALESILAEPVYSYRCLITKPAPVACSVLLGYGT